MSLEDNGVTADSSELGLLTQASITFEYLHTNSTTHESVLGAIAELVDNSRDAGAHRLEINYDAEKEMLTFVDDGRGMSRSEVESVMAFGHSCKRMNDQMIGQYGNGLKSGTMRIGKDFMLFTKKDDMLTALLLSRTFHEKNRLKKVFVPIPSFTTDQLDYFVNAEDKERHGLEMKIIYENTPFKTFSEVMQQFSSIQGDSGTVINCFNLRRVVTGELEIDVNSNLEDIRVKNLESPWSQEVTSLRDYLSVLYSKPKMQIYIRDMKVSAPRLLSTLYMPRKYLYRAKNLKACAQKEYEMRQERVKDLKDNLREAQSNLAVFQKNNSYAVSPLQGRYLGKAVTDAKALLDEAEAKVGEAKKAISNPRPITFYFGLNILQRNRCGCLIYNNGRLITNFEPAECQKTKDGMKYLGVCGIVDVPYSVLEPTQNKQSFANKRDYVALMKAFNEHMLQYWIDANIENCKEGGIEGFWRQLGYSSLDWGEGPSSSDREAALMRNVYAGKTVQCSSCEQWRTIPFQVSYLNGFPEEWQCNMNPDGSLRSCCVRETFKPIPEGKLTHAVKCMKRGPINGNKVIDVSSSEETISVEPISAPADAVRRGRGQRKSVTPEPGAAPARRGRGQGQRKSMSPAPETAPPAPARRPRGQRERRSVTAEPEAAPVRRSRGHQRPSPAPEAAPAPARRSRGQNQRKSMSPAPETASVQPVRRSRGQRKSVTPEPEAAPAPARRAFPPGQWVPATAPPLRRSLRGRKSKSPATPPPHGRRVRRKREGTRVDSQTNSAASSDEPDVKSAKIEVTLETELVHSPSPQVSSAPASTSNPSSVTTDSSDQLNKAVEVIRRLIQSNLPDGVTRFDVLTMPTEDIVNYDAEGHERRADNRIKDMVLRLRAAEEKKKEDLLNNVVFALQNMPDTTRFQHLSRSNVEEELKKIVADLKKNENI